MEQRKPMMIRLDKDLWVFLKRLTIDRETNLNALMNLCVRQYKNKLEKLLTQDDI